ncbi:MAG: peptidoglycan-binding protein [Planctomycetales bacterium]|nr:peptidoglycan-binding protein [Planctomycetales bacterium]
MPLTSPRFAASARLQQAALNSPVMRQGEKGEPVAIVQRALLDLGYLMPITTKKTGCPDGIYGVETANVVLQFQRKHGLGADGITGTQTLEKLDALLPAPAASRLPYMVPGLRVVLAQPSPMGCWATVYTMMKSWKDQASYPIRDAVGAVGVKWRDYYDASFAAPPQGLPSSEFGPFLVAARMSHEPMMNLTIEGWVSLLRRHGLLWIGASVTINPNTGLHSRILEGMAGDGTPSGTTMKMIDPDGGRQYVEPFMVFLAKYESGILSVGGEYFQIRHF